MAEIDDVPWAVIARKFHRLDSRSTPSVTLCGRPYRGWVWDAVAVADRQRVEQAGPQHKRIKMCQGCEQRARRAARVAAATALFPPVRPEPEASAQERIRRRRAQELADLDRDGRHADRSVSARSATAGLPTLGRHQS